MNRAFFVPEVIQTSLTDCGPAALKSVLQGFGIDANYESLRTLCQTDVDGTSIDAVATLGREFGLETSEILIAHDSLLLPEADCLPAIVPTYGGGGATHFVVLWNLVGPYVQVMDPTGGRRWIHRDTLLANIPRYHFSISKEHWQRWLVTADALDPLDAKMRRIGLDPSQRSALLEEAQKNVGWLPFAKLDAAVRMISTLVRGRTIRAGSESMRLLELLVSQRAADDEPCFETIPRGFWWALPGRSPDLLDLNGLVLVHFERHLADVGNIGVARKDVHRFLWGNAPPQAQVRTKEENCISWDREAAKHTDRALPKAIVEELASANVAPVRMLARTIQFDAPGAIGMLVVSAVLASVVAVAEVFLFRGLIDMTGYLVQRYQRIFGVLAVLLFTLGALGVELYIVNLLARVGRGLEARLRVGLLEKLPRFDDAYLRSRPTSDMASRAHGLHLIRQVPSLTANIVSFASSYVATLITFVWLEPSSARLAFAAAVVGLGVPYFLRKPLAESMMRLLTHTGALDRFYLDGLTGAVPVRAHSAELALRREHESLLVEWARTARLVLVQTTWMRLIQSGVGSAIAAALVAGYVLGGGVPSRILVIAFFALRLPAIGDALVTQIVAAHETLNAAHRLFAPLAGKESGGTPSEIDSLAAHACAENGVAISMQGVTVRATGHSVLQGIDLDIRPGEHVAVVGASGAGKSSLMALLLGWLEPSEGEVLVDAAPLDVSQLRRVTMWVDPQTALWNQSLIDNITFGASHAALDGIAEVIHGAELSDVLERLPDGLQTSLGEGGSRLSGGEAQRVRLARGLLRSGVRLLILDEAFRGVERERRRELLRRTLHAWPDATVIVVTHDVADTTAFERVIVLHDGAIAEDGRPSELAARPTRYRELLLADDKLRQNLFTGPDWRHMHVEDGSLRGGVSPGAVP